MRLLGRSYAAHIRSGNQICPRHSHRGDDMMFNRRVVGRALTQGGDFGSAP